MRDEVIGNLMKAVDMAIPAVHNALGMSTDIELDNYRRMMPEDFDDIARRFGIEETADYISKMEKRIIKEI